MKEAFEKIIERLGKRQVLIEASNFTEWNVVDIRDAIDIVKQVAEECKEEYKYKENIAPSKDYFYLTDCGHRHNGMIDARNGCYCGWCGRKYTVLPYQPKETEE